MGNHAKYLNGLAVTSIVFIAIATIPLGIVATIGGLNTNYNETTITLDPGNYTILELDSSYYHFIQYYVYYGKYTKSFCYFSIHFRCNRWFLLIIVVSTHNWISNQEYTYSTNYRRIFEI
ncbi:MAG: hypothetical protein ACTSQ6_10625 [Candidatus Heimdallarchaeaceae archaeon]